MNGTSEKRPWWRLHGATWVAICSVLMASAYLNVNVVDLLYRMKYGPVRPSLIVEGWPVYAVDVDAVSSAMRVDWLSLFADACVSLVIAAGTAAKVEQWRRKNPASLRPSWEHVISLVIVLGAAVVFDVVNRWGSTVDVIDHLAALRWPASTVLFIALGLTCLAFVQFLGGLARRLARWLG
ncbi:MAG: hypothetical protein HQ582_25675 [Planctomycetes bacterium]|nr:hypothetical protein [Planctomycetota bacterium]